MELVNFERVCRTYEEGKEFKENCEKVYDLLLANNREMTPKEIAETIEFKGWLLHDYHPTVQAVTACLKKLKALNLVNRREEEGETIQVKGKGGFNGFRKVFDEKGNCLGEAVVYTQYGKEYDVKTKKVYYSVKNA